MFIDAAITMLIDQIEIKTFLKYLYMYREASGQGSEAVPAVYSKAIPLKESELDLEIELEKLLTAASNTYVFTLEVRDLICRLAKKLSIEGEAYEAACNRKAEEVKEKTFMKNIDRAKTAREYIEAIEIEILLLLQFLCTLTDVYGIKKEICNIWVIK